MSWWIYDYRVKGLDYPTGGFLWVWDGLCLASVTESVVIAGNKIGRTG